MVIVRSDKGVYRLFLFDSHCDVGYDSRCV